jgi:hypothetical protein
LAEGQRSNNILQENYSPEQNNRDKLFISVATLTSQTTVHFGKTQRTLQDKGNTAETASNCSTKPISRQRK